MPIPIEPVRLEKQITVNGIELEIRLEWNLRDSAKVLYGVHVSQCLCITTNTNIHIEYPNRDFKMYELFDEWVKLTEMLESVRRALVNVHENKYILQCCGIIKKN